MSARDMAVDDGRRGGGRVPPEFGMRDTNANVQTCSLPRGGQL